MLATFKDKLRTNEGENLKKKNEQPASVQILLVLLQRWSPRGHILNSLDSKTQGLENCHVLGQWCRNGGGGGGGQYCPIKLTTRKRVLELQETF